MKILDRGFILVQSTNKFIEWSNQHDEDYQDLTSNEPNVYLVEEDVYDDEQLITSKFKEIFLNELASISEDDSTYPEINRANFDLYFTVTFGSCAFDLLA